MADYKITAVSPETRNYETKYGPMVSYRLRLEGVDDVVELSQKTTTPAPQANTTITGEIDRFGPYGAKFKKASPIGGYGSQSGGTGASKPAYQPKDEAAIKAMWAIGQVISSTNTPVTQWDEKDFLLAKTASTRVFRMVDEVKNSGNPVEDVESVDIERSLDQPTFEDSPFADDNPPVKLADIPF